MEQLGELQTSLPGLNEQADVYAINRDQPEQTAQVRQRSGATVPILYDQDLAVAGQYDFLPQQGQPMGGMSGIPQMGFVIIDSQGTIRVQRVDIYFGDNAGQILNILAMLDKGSAP